MPRLPWCWSARAFSTPTAEDDWRLLADYLEIPPYDQAPFEKGDEARAIWVWLENRRRLDLLLEALRDIDREDLAELLHGKLD